jgi:hypothetical protein
MKQSQDDLVQLVGVIIHDVLSRPHNVLHMSSWPSVP